MKYAIYNRSFTENESCENEEHRDKLGESEFVGAKPIRKHYQSAIRALLDHSDEVLITVSNKFECREFYVTKEES